MSCIEQLIKDQKTFFVKIPNDQLLKEEAKLAEKLRAKGHKELDHACEKIRSGIKIYGGAGFAFSADEWHKDEIQVTPEEFFKYTKYHNGFKIKSNTLTDKRILLM